MCSILASSRVQGPWAGAWMIEMSPSQDMGACFWLVELFRDGGEETKKRLGSRSTRLRFELCTSACETYMMQFLLKIFRSVLNLLSAELPDSRGIFVRLESQTVWLKNDEKWWLNLYLISQAARPAACTQHESPSWWEGHTCTKIGNWTQHTSTALRSLWNGKAMTCFLLASRKLHDGARGPRLSAHSVWQPADRRVTAVSKTQHNTLLLPLSGVLCLESVMSDKMSVCGPHKILLLPSSHFEMKKRWPIFCLISQAARRCTRPSAWRAQCVAASWWEGHNRFEDCTHHTFVGPFWCAVPWICHEW